MYALIMHCKPASIHTAVDIYATVVIREPIVFFNSTQSTLLILMFLWIYLIYSPRYGKHYT